MNEHIVPFGLEVWRELDAIGFPGYRVSTFGVVESRVHRKGASLRGTWVKLKPTWRPYASVNLKRSDGKRKNMLVHVLILLAFVGPKPVGNVGRHWDGNERNNTIWNLVWGTQKENCSDKHRHGTIPMGSDHANAKLTDAEVSTMRWLVANRHEFDLTYKRIGELFGVTRSATCNIASGLHRSEAGGTTTPCRPKTILDDEAVREIVKLLPRGPRNVRTLMVYKSIASKFRVSPGSIKAIANGRRWSRITGGKLFSYDV